MRAYTRICEHIRVYAGIDAYMRAYTRICEHIRVYASIYVYMRAYRRICVRIRVYASIYAYVRAYKRICRCFATRKCDDAGATLKLRHLVTPEPFLSDAAASHTNDTPFGHWDTLPPLTVAPPRAAHTYTSAPQGRGTDACASAAARGTDVSVARPRHRRMR
jgi:hypothetical protein